MSRQITIVMYHYIRDTENTKYSDIKGLSIKQFEEQVEYITKYYKVITAEELINNVNLGTELLPNSILLTFDDGYIDHFFNVLPVLKRNKIQGLFFPSAKAIIENEVLDVNKIHFILASKKDKNLLIEDIFKLMNMYRKKYNLKENEHYFKTYANKNRFDTKEIMFIKRILQKGLPEELRKIITKELFVKYVTTDESTFSKELYMSLEHLKYIQDEGMYVGSHGYTHYWLDILEKDKQEEEIDLSLQFLKKIGGNCKHWIVSYPQGAYNDSLLSILKNRGCVIGLTTKVGIADIDTENILALSRLDTNDLPKVKNAEPNDWTIKVIKN